MLHNIRGAVASNKFNTMANFNANAMVNFNSNEFKNVLLGTSNWWGRDHDILVDEYDGIVGRHVIEEWDDHDERYNLFHAYTNNPDAVQVLVEEEQMLDEEEEKAVSDTVWISIGTMLEHGACRPGIADYIENYMPGLHPIEIRNLLKVLDDEEPVSGWYSRLYPVPYRHVQHWLSPSTLNEWNDGEHKVQLSTFLA